MPINIEIKGAADQDVDSFLRNAEILANFLNKLGRTRGIIVASFNDAALTRFHQLAPEIDLAPAVAGVAAYKFGGVAPPEGTRAFQVPISFGGITVVDEAFIDRAHSDGYAVHVWTINDPAEMRQLLEWGADGIMTAEPMRLEQVLCATDSPRPRHPRGTHCGHRRASIACDVRPVAARRAGRTLRVRLRRADDFAGRCAGTVGVRVPGTRGRAAGRFSFGDRPPCRRGAANEHGGYPARAGSAWCSRRRCSGSLCRASLHGLRQERPPRDRRPVTPEPVVIGHRFNGPPSSANGGYACGVVADAIGSAARVSLRAPPPLEVPLTLEQEDGTTKLLDGDTLIAEGVADAPTAEPADAPSLAEARAGRRAVSGSRSLRCTSSRPASSAARFAPRTGCRSSPGRSRTQSSSPAPGPPAPTSPAPTERWLPSSSGRRSTARPALPACRRIRPACLPR